MLKNIFSIVKANRRLIENFISLISLKGIDFLIPLLIFPYLIRTLGIDTFGLLAFSTAFNIYFGAIIHYGYSVTAVRDIARVRDNQTDLNKLYSSLITLSFLLVLVSAIIISFLVLLIPNLKENWLLHFTSFFYISMFSFFPSWFFQGIEKMKFIAYINLVSKILYMVSLFLLVLKPEDYILVPFLHGVFMLISVIISFLIIHKHFKLKYIKPSKADLKKILKEGRHAFIVQLAPTLYNSTTTFILGYTATYTLVGVYASATKLIDALNSISIIILNTFLPYLSINIKRHKTFSYIMWSVALVLVILAFVFSDFLITFLYGAKNLVVSDWFKLLIPMVLFVFIRNTYGPSYLMLINKERVYKNIVLYSCVSFFILSIILVPVYSLKGAVFIMLGATFIMSGYTYYYFLKYRE